MSNKLPSVTSEIPRDLRTFIDRLREIITGNGNDRLVTAQDLINGGLASAGTNGTLVPIKKGVIAPPPAPQNLTTTGSVNSIFVEWDNPTYYGHDYTEVYSGGIDVLGDAVLLGFTPGVNYVDTIGPQQSRYYWARFINTEGTAGPFNSINGTRGQTGVEVEHMLEVLTGSITESQLYQDLGARINLIDGLSSVAGSVNARIQAEATARANAILDEAAARGAAITNEATIRQSADSSLASQITTITASVSGNAAAIQAEATARANADSAEATARQTLAARVTDAETGLTAAQAAITTESSTRATADTALSSQITALTSTVDANTAAITTEATTRANADSALSSQITTLSSTVGSNTTAIQQEASTRATQTGDLFAKYTVKIDANGYVSGFGLASTANNATPFSDFIIRADRFSISNPSGPTASAPVVPFIVTTTSQTIDGTTVPPGVYIDGAYIKGGTIKGSAIEAGTITGTKLIDVSANKITGAALAATSYIESAAYIAGTQGWKIHANGTAEFAAASIRGQLTASQINSNGLSIRDTNGTIILNAGTGAFTGNVTGTISGTAASTVVSNASTALSTANTASTNASTALTTANTANTNANTAISGLANKLNSDSRNILAGSGGLATGSLNWNSSGVRTSGSGVGLTANGLVAYNSAGNATFTLNGTSGDATFAGNLSAAGGTFSGSLSAASGTFAGTLTAAAIDAVNTINIAGNAVTVPLTATGASGTAFSTGVSVNIRTSTAYYPAGTTITALFTALKTAFGAGDIYVILNILNSSNTLVATFAGSTLGALVQTMGPNGDKVTAIFTGTYTVASDGNYKIEAIVSNPYGGSWTSDYCTIIALGSKK